MDVEKLLSQLTSFGTEWGLKVVGVLVALFVAFKVANWTKKKISNALDGRSFDATLSRFFANCVKYAILGGAILGCLGVFGIETSSFAALIAAMGLAIGLAFQGSLSNFAAGVMLLVFRPFKVGDFIRAGGEKGTVEALELFTTELKTPDNRRVIVPNSSIFGGTIENVSHHPVRRVDIPVGVAYDADIDHARAVLEGVPSKVEGALQDPGAQIFLSELGASSVDWVVRVWCNSADYWDVWQRTVRQVKLSLDEAGIGIPFPQLDLHLDEGARDSIIQRKAS